MKDFKDTYSHHRGFRITRKCGGKYGTTYRYECGNVIAPRKKDVIKEIDDILDKKLLIEHQISKLDKMNLE